MNTGSGTMTSQGNMANPAGGNVDWTNLIAHYLQGTGQGIQGMAQGGPYRGGKYEAKEMRRRTVADMLKGARGRRNATENMGRKMGMENQDVNDETMQQMARGFVSAMRGGR